MKIRKRLSKKKRLGALCYGLVGIGIALLIAQYVGSDLSGPIAFFVGLFGVGGIYRCLAGYDEV